MDVRELLKKIRRLEIATRRAVETELAGGYHSVFKGRGMVVSDVRPYQQGDDWRAVDWNVTARTGDLHVKQFVEERELTVVLVVDVSKSMHFGTRVQLKRELVAQVAALIGFSAIRNRDKVGLLLFSDRIERYLPPKRGRGHGFRVVREVLGCEPTGKGTRLDLALEFLGRVVHHGAVVFVLSDFFDSTGQTSKASPAVLKRFVTIGTAEIPPHDESARREDRAFRIASARHDVVAVEVIDPFEEILPDAGLLELRDLETGLGVCVDSGDRAVRERFAARSRERRLALGKRLERLGIDSVRVRTDADPVKPLVAFFAQRKKRRTGGRR